MLQDNTAKTAYEQILKAMALLTAKSELKYSEYRQLGELTITLCDGFTEKWEPNEKELVTAALRKMKEFSKKGGAESDFAKIVSKSVINSTAVQHKYFLNEEI